MSSIDIPCKLPMFKLQPISSPCLSVPQIPFAFAAAGYFGATIHRQKLTPQMSKEKCVDLTGWEQHQGLRHRPPQGFFGPSPQEKQSQGIILGIPMAWHSTSSVNYTCRVSPQPISTPRNPGKPGTCSDLPRVGRIKAKNAGISFFTPGPHVPWHPIMAKHLRRSFIHNKALPSGFLLHGDR
jgi:hypothetical protein